MKVIKPYIEIEPVNGYQILMNLEKYGRTCYKSESKITSDSCLGFIRGIISRGHFSVLEHEKVTAKIVCNRGVSHELVRHRIASYCLTGDTIVRSISQKQWAIEDLYNWKSNDKLKGRLKLIKLRSVDSNNIVIANKIKNIFCNGKKMVYELKTQSNRVIKSTNNHRFLTPDGYVELKNLKIGDFVLSNGIPALGTLTVFKDLITDITPIGIENTYDISMEKEPYNFVANGIVVHNSQESTRYVNYKDGITVTEPVFWNSNSDKMAAWGKAMINAEKSYKYLIEIGAKAEEARSVLPNSLKTEVVTTFNLREWRHFFYMRCNLSAHIEIRQIAIMLLEKMQKYIPILFDDFIITKDRLSAETKLLPAS